MTAPRTDVVRDTDTPEVSDTDIHASEVCNDDAPFAIALRVSSCHVEYVPATNDDGRWCGWFLDADTRSWARFDYLPGAQRWPVHQFGPRRLWDEITTAYQQWDHAGQRPAYPRFGDRLQYFGTLYCSLSPERGGEVVMRGGRRGGIRGGSVWWR